MPRASVAILFAVALAALAGGGCRTTEEPTPAVTTRPIEQVLAEHTPSLMRIDGVVGTAQGETPERKPCILVLVARETPAIRAAIPRQIEGWPVQIMVTGEIKAMPDTGR
jgi:hypothetical protein